MSLDQDLQFDDTDAMGWQVECALVQFLRDLDLKNGSNKADSIGRKVYPRMFSDGTGIQYPAIEVSEEGQSESRGIANDVSEEVIYPFLVSITDKVSERRHERKRLYKRWREEILQKLDRKLGTLATLKQMVPAIYDIEVSPRQIFARDQEFNHVFSNLLVQVSIKRKKVDNGG